MTELTLSLQDSKWIVADETFTRIDDAVQRVLELLKPTKRENESLWVYYIFNKRMKVGDTAVIYTDAFPMGTGLYLKTINGLSFDERRSPEPEATA